MTDGARKQPHLLVAEGDVADLALLPGDPDRVDRIADRCESRELVAENREYRVVNATYGGRELTLCSTGIGCPSAAIAVEELSRVGCETFLRAGTAGALQPGIGVGDLVVATAAAKREGTTRRYEGVELPAVADHAVVSALVDAARGDDVDGAKPEADGGAVPVHVGPVVSDDAFYPEVEGDVERDEAAGMVAVEMEAAAILTIARRRGLRAGAVCTVDGNLAEATGKGETDDEELPAAADDGVGRMIERALAAATAL
jgi:uridine phosphorylase